MLTLRMDLLFFKSYQQMDHFYDSIRAKISNKIKQLPSVADNQSNLDLSFLSQDQFMQKSNQTENNRGNRYMENNELEMQIKGERQKLHQCEMAIDKLRIKMIEITDQEDNLKKASNQKRMHFNDLKMKIEKEHKAELEKMENGYQMKKQSILKQIQELIAEKGQMLSQVQKMAEQIKKADNRNKRAKQNYQKEMKSKKEAFISIQREKGAKYQKTRVQQLKQKAIKDTEPKLLAIIKSSNDDIKKAEETQRNKLEEFKVEYKLKLQKELTAAKKTIFEQTEQQKQQNRMEIERRNKQKYIQRQKQLEHQISQLKQQYANRIKDEERKIRADMEEFIMRNKDSYQSNIDEMKQLKANYEAKLKKMNQNLKELKDKKLIQYEEKYKRIADQNIQQINQNSEEKYHTAEQKIKKDISDKINNIKNQISKEKNAFIDDINKKYQKILFQQIAKMDETAQKEKKSLQEYESKIIELQKQRSKEEGKAQQMKKESNGLLSRIQDLKGKIASHQAQIQAYERYKLSKEKETKKKCDEFNLQMQQKIKQLNSIYQQKQSEKQAHLKQLLDKFQQQNNESQKELHELHELIRQKVKHKQEELKRIQQENSKLQRQNQIFQKQIEEQSQKLRS